MWIECDSCNKPEDQIDVGLTDVEMIALASVAQCDAAQVIVANQDRESRGLGMAYENCESEARDRLVADLRRRGVLR